MFKWLKDFFTYETVDEDQIVYDVTKAVEPKTLSNYDREHCLSLAYDAIDYSEIEAMSVAYILAQTYPKVLMKALMERFDEN